MDLENLNNKKNAAPLADDFDFDFKPITSGLGFHHGSKTQEIKPVFTDKPIIARTSAPQITPVAAKKEMNVYQNDLSMFYNQAPPMTMEAPPLPEIKEEKVYRLATKPQRIVAYLADLLFIASLLGMVLTVMARTISMDLMDVWSQYPNEITPLFVTLFCGFYLIYFSVFEKAGQSTLGKSLFNLKVVSEDNKTLSLLSLLARSTVSLLNFVSLGLFSYFDLQNKITSSKVIRID